MLKLPISEKEKKLVYLIANNWSHPKLDKIMITISNPYRWLLPALGLCMFLIYINWDIGIRALLLAGIAASIADSINSRILKQHTDRIRPGKQYSDIRSLGIMNRGRKSFPSNHASNTMSFAIGIGLMFPWAMYVLVPLSLLVGYSRIYCGAHFPLDVIAGWLHGAIWVFLLYSFINMI